MRKERKASVRSRRQALLWQYVCERGTTYMEASKTPRKRERDRHREREREGGGGGGGQAREALREDVGIHLETNFGYRHSKELKKPSVIHRNHFTHKQSRDT